MTASLNIFREKVKKRGRYGNRFAEHRNFSCTKFEKMCVYYFMGKFDSAGMEVK